MGVELPVMRAGVAGAAGRQRWPDRDESQILRALAEPVAVGGQVPDAKPAAGIDAGVEQGDDWAPRAWH